MIKFTARVTPLACLLAIFSFGQEFAWNAFPEQMRKPIPDAVLYRLLLEHVSAFENQARLNDAQGQSGEAWRNHLAHQFGLPADELSGIVQVALELTDQLSKLRSQQRAIATRFRTAEIRTQGLFSAQSLSAVPPELLGIEAQIKALSLQSRDRIKASLSDSQFPQLESKLRKRRLVYSGCS